MVDLENECLPLGPINPEGCSRFQSVLSIVDKYRADVNLSNGLRALEAMALKTLGIARGLPLKGKDEYSKMADLEGAISIRDLRIVDLEEERAQLMREREQMRNDLRNAQDEVGTAKDKTEHLKLELERTQKELDAKLADTRDDAVEDFKKSDAFNELKDKYAMGSYFHALKEARAFIRLRPDARPEDLKSIPEVADDLQLSESEENGGDEDVDIEGDDVEEGQGSQNTDV
ncbi:tropomyosin-like [Olea europaea var. sylvestris]|uniref:tropomyosin-like n=1 Tax=Olea europaea var. sylvestris TaxID=158386 RepID=UPI000C1CE2FE|nr:tropomyosin-like [Olea europaea var. sylvestris]